MSAEDTARVIVHFTFGVIGTLSECKYSAYNYTMKQRQVDKLQLV